MSALTETRCVESPELEEQLASAIAQTAAMTAPTTVRRRAPAIFAQRYAGICCSFSTSLL
jgi:hypothetical protein